MKSSRRRTLSPVDPERVKTLLAQGLSTYQTARVLKCTQGRVWQIATGYVQPRRDTAQAAAARAAKAEQSRKLRAERDAAIAAAKEDYRRARTSDKVSSYAATKGLGNGQRATQ